MTNLFVVVFPFREKDFRKLESILNQSSINAWLGSDDRSLAARLFNGAVGRRVFYYFSEDQKRLSDLIDGSGYVVQGHLPRPYHRLKIRPKQGNKFRGPTLKSAIEYKGQLKSYVDGDFVYVHEDHRSRVLQLIEEHSFEIRDEISYRENS